LRVLLAAALGGLLLSDERGCAADGLPELLPYRIELQVPRVMQVTVRTWRALVSLRLILLLFEKPEKRLQRGRLRRGLDAKDCRLLPALHELRLQLVHKVVCTSAHFIVLFLS
jgi:hypothetical protein